ncbi:hypothetical protein TWF569_006000 [Orbilia oligospora]|uniref:ENTH domain-containing protein n=2 Tax=Orbilia oligospora TaxID=2813651 RepID=A0A7C8NBN0_ORBOL|nr:hypothetical protein TWF103_010668 [Orbilia oligospora]KAF3101584.1 hypothetical protein TWF102_004830 [Orbilia oligospora]KAF3108251.1 hypothetical protein TWF706_002147 [Orbilia oligospora]KAF3128994.1 hypothetical protein TWF594_011168 [Orbilia oligospora]KAF3147891.1 hypothetical protein TWF569_006000 [Orbilia oligospora]
MSSFEKSVKGATKVKVAAPKSKYVEHILIATHAGEAGIAEVFRALNNRMKDQTWTIVFKSLIVVHLMIREGEQDVTLRYLRKHPRLVAISNYSDVQEQGKNIRRYSQYLGERARSFGDVKVDFVRNGQGHLRRLSVEKGLLREVECVQTQMRALLQCNFHTGDVDNEITLTAFRMLVSDLLAFFHVVNEGVINVLEHYFEMSRYDAERALEIYKVFTRQTEDTVEFLQNARRLETATRLQIPNVKHAPTSLTKSLEEYLLDPDFDVNRRQYLAAQEAKKTGKKIPTTDISATSKTTPLAASTTTSAPQAPVAAAQQQAAPAPQKQGDLIDFFASIENEQTPMFGGTPTTNAQPTFAQQPVPIVAPQIQVPIIPTPQFSIQQQPGFVVPGQVPQVQVPQQFLVQNPVPFSMQQPLQTDFTGAGFGGYTPAPQPTIAPIPQPVIQTAPIIAPNLTASVQTPQSAQGLLPSATGSTNPFRQSMMPTGSSVASPIASTGTGGSTGTSRGTNPFARASTIPVAAPQVAPTFSSTSTDYSQNTPQQSQPQIQAPLRSASTGSTNPFSRPKAENTLPSVSEASQGANGGFSQASLPSFQPSGGLNVAQPTGTNPFRQSKLPADLAPQISMGGLEHLETIPVFPRSDQQQQNQQQSHGQGQWGGF